MMGLNKKYRERERERFSVFLKRGGVGFQKAGRPS
jgi:hypothetical protein